MEVEGLEDTELQDAGETRKVGDLSTVESKMASRDDASEKEMDSSAAKGTVQEHPGMANSLASSLI